MAAAGHMRRDDGGLATVRPTTVMIQQLIAPRPHRRYSRFWKGLKNGKWSSVERVFFISFYCFPQNSATQEQLELMQRKIKIVLNAGIDVQTSLRVIQMKSKPAALSVVIQIFTVVI